MKLDDLIRYICAFESAKEQAKEMSKSQSQPITSGGNDNPGIAKGDLNAIQGQKKGSNSYKKRSDDKSKDFVECYRCGKNGHSGRDSRCPGWNIICSKCNIKGHFAAKCRTRNNRKRPNIDDSHVKPKTEKIRCIREDDDDDATSSSNFIFNIGDGDDLIWCKIGGILIEMLIDSGTVSYSIKKNKLIN